MVEIVLLDFKIFYNMEVELREQTKLDSRWNKIMHMYRQ